MTCAHVLQGYGTCSYITILTQSNKIFPSLKDYPTSANVLFRHPAGLTETCAGSLVARPDEFNMIGTVGPPLPIVDICLESVPDMGYDALSSTPRGEICIRGKCLFSGYYKREDLTKQVMINEWFHTGVYIFPFGLFSFYSGKFLHMFFSQQEILGNGSQMGA